MSNGLQVIFLGTGTSQGVPLIGCTCKVCKSEDPKNNRLRSSIYISDGSTSIVVDTGPDFRQQMLVNEITSLDAVVFTHGHKDHTAGFDDIRAFNFIQRRDMDVWLDERVEEVIRKDFDYVFSAIQYPGIPKANLHRIDGRPFEVGTLHITPIEALHYKLPVYGFRVGDFTYITDANHLPDESMAKITGTKTLVLNALRREEHISHFTLDQAVAMAQRIGAEQTYFTHISHQLGEHESVVKELPKGITLAYDTLKIECS